MNHQNIKFFSLLLCLCMLFSIAAGQLNFLESLQSDTLTLNMPFDSNIQQLQKIPRIKDNRQASPKCLGISQTEKYMFIPVDQYIMLNNSLNRSLSYYLDQDSIKINDTLVIDNLTLWYDSKPFFASGHVINGYSYVEQDGEPVKEWMWEIRRKKKFGQTNQEILSLLASDWLQAQSDSLSNLKFSSQISPYEYRRVLRTWTDFIILQNGYIINANLTLDFPKNLKKMAVFGSSGIYFRHSPYFQSIGIMALDQHWLQRLNNRLTIRLNSNFRLGVNKLNSDKFDNPDFKNIMMANLGLSGAIQYQPEDHRGLFFGAGLYLNINGLPHLPNKLDIFEPGILFILGLRLP